MHLPQQRPAGLGVGVDAVYDEADVPVVVLTLGSLGECPDVCKRQRMELQQLPEVVDLLRSWILELEPEEFLALQMA